MSLRQKSALFSGIPLLLLLLGFIARIFPLFDFHGRMLYQFPIEDSYYMMTVARNIALGKGMSIAAGTIPTNGVQALSTFLWAFIYFIINGDKMLGILFIQIVEMGIALIATFLLFRLGQKLLINHANGEKISAWAAGLWFFSPVTVSISQNCLETGLYTALILGFANLYISETKKRNLQFYWGLGALLGICFWARNDAVFLALAVFLCHSISAFFEKKSVRKTALEVSVMAFCFACIASPWLFYNWNYFGDIVPISGLSQYYSSGVDAIPERFTNKFPWCITGLAENCIPFITHNWWKINGYYYIYSKIVCLFIGIATLIIAYRSNFRTRQIILLVTVFAFLLIGYYGFVAGHSWFFRRYLFPLSPFLALVLSCIIHSLIRFDKKLAILIPTLVLCLGLWHHQMIAMWDKNEHVRWWGIFDYRPFERVEWVKTNVPKDTWIGALQTGVLGYFYDKSINLDGKVNLDALHARIDYKLFDYVKQSPIQYIIDDQYMISDILRHKEFLEEFTLVDENEVRGVLIRKQL